MKIRSRIRHLNFNKKMQLFIGISIGVMALVIFLITMLFLMTSMTNKSRELAYEQISVVADNMANELYTLTHICYGINLDENLQEYMRTEQASAIKNYDLISNVKDNLHSYLNMNPNLNFIAVIDNDFENSIYSGIYNLAESGFESLYRQDYEESKSSGRGIQKINFGSVYFNGDKQTLTIYQPLIHTKILNRRLGTLCLNVDRSLFLPERSQTDFDFSTYVVDLDGNIVLGDVIEGVDQHLEIENIGNTISGSYEDNQNLYILKKINNYDFYVIGIIPMNQFYKDTVFIVLLLAVMVAIFVAFSLIVVSKLIDINYKPMKKVVDAMDTMISGDLSPRLSLDNTGDDFLLLTQGFNGMMDTIDSLLETVATEHKQKEQVRFNALQSQIKPHFLYNTLDSIHWQAATDGNKEVSRLVKALASYYRLCLSKGEDVISLSKECEQVESYMEIQNIRYNHIVNFDVKLAPELFDQKIPKMTLQPIVENSIYHGIRIKENNTGSIWIDGRVEGNRVIISVKDNGDGTDEAGLERINKALNNPGVAYGYGIQNVNKRIKLLFGEAYGMEYKINRMGGITAIVILPRESID